MTEFRLLVLPRWVRDYIPLILWMLLIYAVSSRSTLVDLNSQIGEKLTFKSSHIVAYAVLAWFWWRALSPRRDVEWPLLVITFVLTVLYGISDEIHQLYVPGRHGRVTDVLFDASGALLMVLFLRRFCWLRHFPEVLPSSRASKETNA